MPGWLRALHLFPLPGTAATSQAAALSGTSRPHYSQPCRCDNFQKPELFVILSGWHSKINCVQRSCSLYSDPYPCCLIIIEENCLSNNNTRVPLFLKPVANNSLKYRNHPRVCHFDPHHHLTLHPYLTYLLYYTCILSLLSPFIVQNKKWLVCSNSQL